MSRSGEKSQMLKIMFILQTYHPCQFCLRLPKNVICFALRHLEMPKIEFQKSDVITLNWFLGHCTAKHEDFGIKLSTRLVGT